MAGYRAHAGQMSDARPIRRNLPEMERQLRDIREYLASMSPRVAPATRATTEAKARALELEIENIKFDRIIRHSHAVPGGPRERRSKMLG